MARPPDPTKTGKLSAEAIAQAEQALLLKAQVARSISTIRTQPKKGKTPMADSPPILFSTKRVQLDLWAKELLDQSGPKTKDGEAESYKSFLAKVPSVLNNIGTHGFKLPIPEVDTQPIYADSSLKKQKIPGVLCEGDLSEPCTLIFSGNGGDIRVAKFLLAQITLDSIKTSVLNELIKGTESQITAALIRCGVPSIICDMVSDFNNLRLQQDISRLPIHPLTKQIYFEEEGKEDVLLIPVAPESLISKLHSQAQKPGRWLALQGLCAVGGTKPLNGGPLCNDLGGRFQLLQAVPPEFGDRSLQSRVTRGGTVYTKYSVSNTDVLTFIHAAGIEQVTGNKRKRDDERLAYQWFAQTMLAALLETDNLVAARAINPPKESGGIGLYLQRNRDEPVSADVAIDAAHGVFDIVVKYNQNLRQHIADTHIRATLINMMVEILL